MKLAPSSINNLNFDSGVKFSNITMISGRFMNSDYYLKPAGIAKES